MTSDRWDDDELLLADLLAAVSAAPAVPEPMLAAANAVWTWRTVNDELLLASLSFDSRLQPVSGLRAGEQEQSRTMVFDWPVLSVEIEVIPGRLVGQLVPAARGDVRLLTSDGEYAATATDEVGSFVLDRPAAGPVRLVCRAGNLQGQTEWLTL